MSAWQEPQVAESTYPFSTERAAVCDGVRELQAAVSSTQAKQTCTKPVATLRVLFMRANIDRTRSEAPGFVAPGSIRSHVVRSVTTRVLHATVTVWERRTGPLRAYPAYWPEFRVPLRHRGRWQPFRCPPGSR